MTTNSIEERLRHLEKLEKRVQMLEDIHQIQNLMSKERYLDEATLFDERWQSAGPENTGRYGGNRCPGRLRGPRKYPQDHGTASGTGRTEPCPGDAESVPWRIYLPAIAPAGCNRRFWVLR